MAAFIEIMLLALVQMFIYIWSNLNVKCKKTDKLFTNTKGHLVHRLNVCYLDLSRCSLAFFVGPETNKKAVEGGPDFFLPLRLNFCRGHQTISL